MELEINKIIQLVNCGVLNTTEHDVPVADAYKASKFRRALKAAFDEVAERERTLAKEVGIEDISKLAEAPEEKRKRFNELQGELYKDKIDLSGIKPMSYESFHALAKENRNTPTRLPAVDKDGKETVATINVDVFRSCEDLLEGILWVAPDEN